MGWFEIGVLLLGCAGMLLVSILTCFNILWCECINFRLWKHPVVDVEKQEELQQSQQGISERSAPKTLKIRPWHPSFDVTSVKTAKKILETFSNRSNGSSPDTMQDSNGDSVSESESTQASTSTKK
uniref:Uncharacterized protein n=1 Tax=Acrobeloides nanus TaxID=290746 RepID=A0A914DG26_9BILA